MLYIAYTVWSYAIIEYEASIIVTITSIHCAMPSEVVRVMIRVSASGILPFCILTDSSTVPVFSSIV